MTRIHKTDKAHAHTTPAAGKKASSELKALAKQVTKTTAWLPENSANLVRYLGKRGTFDAATKVPAKKAAKHSDKAFGRAVDKEGFQDQLPHQKKTGSSF